MFEVVFWKLVTSFGKCGLGEIEGCDGKTKRRCPADGLVGEISMGEVGEM